MADDAQVTMMMCDDDDGNAGVFAGADVVLPSVVASDSPRYSPVLHSGTRSQSPSGYPFLGTVLPSRVASDASSPDVYAMQAGTTTGAGVRPGKRRFEGIDTPPISIKMLRLDGADENSGKRKPGLDRSLVAAAAAGTGVGGDGGVSTRYRVVTDAPPRVPLVDLASRKRRRSSAEAPDAKRARTKRALH